MNRNQTITALRALAAFTVFISHAANSGMAPEILGGGFGQIGVMLFFGLSGFLMTTLYSERPFDSANFSDFIKARIGRVVPLYFLVLGTSIVLTWLLGDLWHYQLTDTGTIVLAATFVSAPYELWSIPVEIHYYLVFSVLWWAMSLTGSRGARLALHAGVMLAAITGMLLARAADIESGILPYYLLPFVIGSLLALCRHDHWLVATFSGQRGSWIGLFAILLFVLNIPLWRVELGWTWGGLMTRTWLDPINIVSVTLLLAAAVFQSQPLRVLTIAPVIFLGEVSYGFYLFHRPIMELVSKSGLQATVGGGLALLMTFAFTIALAALSFYAFERHALRAIRKWGSSGPEVSEVKQRSV